MCHVEKCCPWECAKGVMSTDAGTTCDVAMPPCTSATNCALVTRSLTEGEWFTYVVPNRYARQHSRVWRMMIIRGMIIQATSLDLSVFSFWIWLHSGIDKPRNGFFLRGKVRGSVLHIAQPTNPQTHNPTNAQRVRQPFRDIDWPFRNGLRYVSPDA
jgi:hypothetical protein